MNKQEAINYLQQGNYLGKHMDDAVSLAILALEQQLNNEWIPIDSRLPEREQEVWIQTEKGTMTTAMYEDGKMSDENSAWNWTDIDFKYDEETDINYIPEGWWEYRHFNPDDVYNCCVDEKVIEWQPLPERYKEDNNA